MKLYAVTSHTNYGDTITLINAENEIDANKIAYDNEDVWDGYAIEEIDTVAVGVTFFGGGE